LEASVSTNLAKGTTVLVDAAAAGRKAVRNADTSLPPSFEMSLSLEVSNIESVVDEMKDAFVAVVNIFDWDWIKSVVEGALSGFNLYYIKFGLEVNDGVPSDFTFDCKFKAFGADLDLKFTPPFMVTSLPQFIKEAGRDLVLTVLDPILDIVQLPPFDDGHPCIMLIPGICKGTCLMHFCVPDKVIEALVKPLKDAAKAVGQAIGAAAKWSVDAAKAIFQGIKDIGDAIGDIIPFGMSRVKLSELTVDQMLDLPINVAQLHSLLHYSYDGDAHAINHLMNHRSMRPPVQNNISIPQEFNMTFRQWMLEPGAGGDLVSKHYRQYKARKASLRQ